MSELVKIDDEVITEEDFVRNLKLTNEYSEMLMELIKNKVTVHAAKKRGIEISAEELQDAANAFRLSLGLHRAKDTHDWLRRNDISILDFENFISEQVLKNKMIETISSDGEIEAYFKLNSPKFDTVDVNRVVAAGEDKAREIFAVLEDDPDSFDELAEEFVSGDDPLESSEKLAGLRRDSLSDEISAKLFNAGAGDVIGPFHMGVEDYYEVLMVTDIHPAKLDDTVRSQISDAIYEEWLQSRFQEFSITQPGTT